MLAEFQHRLANDLAVALGALALTRNRAAGTDDQLIDEAARRIGTLAVMHRLLAPPLHEGSVDIADTLAALCEGLTESRLASAGILLTLRVDPAQVDRAIAWMLGVLVAELVTNSHKHAFGDGRGGEIVVEIEGPPGDLVLRVADNGRGTDRARPPADGTGGCGSAIVEALVDHVGGRLSRIITGAGTLVEIELAPMRCPCADARSTGRVAF